MIFTAMHCNDRRLFLRIVILMVIKGGQRARRVRLIIE